MGVVLNHRLGIKNRFNILTQDLEPVVGWHIVVNILGKKKGSTFCVPDLVTLGNVYQT